MTQQKIITIIFGKKSCLSQALRNKIKNSFITTIDDFLNEKKIFEECKNKKINIIINSFYPSSKLSEIISYYQFYKKSIEDLSRLLDSLHFFSINRIIYSSSSSIYNSYNNFKKKDTQNKKIYSSSKFACENLIVNYCQKKNISFNICRIFNMYGNNDSFSIISKIIKCYRTRNKLLLNNNGKSIRDFINVNDVANTYKNILSSDISGIVDLGNGFGYEIKDILMKIGIKNFNITNLKTEEEVCSIAKNIYQKIAIPKKKSSLEGYIKKKLRIKKSLKFTKIYSSKKNLINETIEGNIIYGAGNAGIQLCDILEKNNKDSVYCFVDDNRKLQNKKIKNKKIISFDNLFQLSQNIIVPNIIIAIPSLSYVTLFELLDKLRSLALNVSFLPLKKITNDKIFLEDLQDAKLVDLFQRKISKIDQKILRGLDKKTILVTGAGGSIGSELCLQLSKQNIKKIIALDISELALYNLQNKTFNSKKIVFILGSILDEKLIKFLYNKYKINTIFHTAAFKHLDILENNILQAVQNNIYGTLNLLKCMINKKINFVLISTDKAAKPSSILGLSKRIAEITTQSYFSKYNTNIVRFGNVFGSQGSAINLFINQINNGGPVTITNKKVKRFFMSIQEACNLVMHCSQLKLKSQIFILNMGKPLLLLDIIKKLIFYKTKNIPNLNIEIKEIGLKPGEKIVEVLTLSNRLLKTAHPDILSSREPLYSVKELNHFFSNLQDAMSTRNNSKIKLCMKNFLKNEL
jgi:FlaA1/EpsC-like NDP-sugar epimerase